MLRFCYDTTIPPTNNLADRDLRPNKTQQKISGRFTSDTVTRNHLASAATYPPLPNTATRCSALPARHPDAREVVGELRLRGDTMTTLRDTISCTHCPTLTPHRPHKGGMFTN